MSKMLQTDANCLTAPLYMYRLVKLVDAWSKYLFEGAAASSRSVQAETGRLTSHGYMGLWAILFSRAVR